MGIHWSDFSQSDFPKEGIYLSHPYYTTLGSEHEMPHQIEWRHQDYLSISNLLLTDYFSCKSTVLQFRSIHRFSSLNILFSCSSVKTPNATNVLSNIPPIICTVPVVSLPAACFAASLVNRCRIGPNRAAPRGSSITLLSVEYSLKVCGSDLEAINCTEPFRRISRLDAPISM